MDKIIILDFGSQVTQVIGRRVRELNVYCEIHPFNKFPFLAPDSSSAGEKIIPSDIKGVILSGSPFSVREKNAPQIDLSDFFGKIPVLGICYGAQYIAYNCGGNVEASQTREYGRAELTIAKIANSRGKSGKGNNSGDSIFNGIPKKSFVWMSHGDSITKLPKGAELIASTSTVKNAAYKMNVPAVECKSSRSKSKCNTLAVYAFQFHPEVFHSQYGGKMLENFVMGVCGCKGDWTTKSFIKSTVAELKKKIGNDQVILGLSGGVDSSVAAVLINKAIGKNLHCIFVDNGLLRKNEYEEVLKQYRGMGLNVIGVDASEKFMTALKGVTDPEKKRKAIGGTFIDVFDSEAQKIKNAKWLAQGTIYPDVIESSSVNGPSAKIKSHHNVGGLPEKMNLKIVEPLRSLFKDEVRRTGRALGIKREVISRHPFPGPGLGIRVLGEVTKEKLQILKEADAIYIGEMRKYMTTLPPASNGFVAEEMAKEKAVGKRKEDCKISLYDAVWQAGTILLPVKSVGVMGDERTYEYTVALRAVVSNDGMTADWVHLPYDFLAKVSNEIINKVKGVNRVCYDISSKPPATIEWE
ncbi:MAG: glutamine-hydrolyzing GMP synthase [Bacteroidales bacterium]|jgi:GMP synthase (glutamine-hydrolysing)|nr:glutamine-hydrolyzing GMP synthase [Bacteroidales bacterium]